MTRTEELSAQDVLLSNIGLTLLQGLFSFADVRAVNRTDADTETGLLLSEVVLGRPLVCKSGEGMSVTLAADIQFDSVFVATRQGLINLTVRAGSWQLHLTLGLGLLPAVNCLLGPRGKVDEKHS